MDNIFEITDKNGRKIRLTKTQWSHIRVRHPDVSEAEIQETIKKPQKIIEEEEDILILYRYFKSRKEPEKYLKVMVKYLNGDGYVVTSYFVRNML
jgi:hypothetical protein